MTHWAVVPARGGSKSIVRKNLHLLAGRPLLDYGVRAAQASKRFGRIICSTDDREISERARHLGIEVDIRPAALATDQALVDDAVRELLERTRNTGASLPDTVTLIQPTSPFVRPEDIIAVVGLLERHKAAASAHNCVAVRHNVHAWNQRQLDSGDAIRFLFRDERLKARSKQQKPRLLAFGNTIAARTEVLLGGGGFYAEPCVGVEIPPPFDFDLDMPADIPLADAIIRSGAVSLDHLNHAASHTPSTSHA